MSMKNPVHPGRIVRHDCLEPLGLSVTAGADRFERSRVQAPFAEKPRQQRGQHGFAGAGVRAGDEERLFHAATSKRKLRRQAIKTVDGIGSSRVSCAAC